MRTFVASLTSIALLVFGGCASRADNRLPPEIQEMLKQHERSRAQDTQRLPSSGEREVIGPDGETYFVSQTAMQSGVAEYGPNLTIVINKPDDASELSMEAKVAFIDKLLTEACAEVQGRPTTENIITDVSHKSGVDVQRYEWQGKQRVSWKKLVYCRPTR
ncbi:MAG: hypothetical protein ABS40_05220 [Agrobacterium sp. SCN 61-19]|nr:MAG: hypothetical protein ABS40_05220 [Agrobacterium sp. SCN 61-19]